jgi:gamma-glutamylcyclotransferase (GGCT)/AIG2-like uncharacterized protein YtfP
VQTSLAWDGTRKGNAARGDHHVGYRANVPAYYFAYGSNLSPARMRERVPSARAEGRARLPGYRLTLDKRGADGSGKANLREAADAAVWGALYSLGPEDWPRLDGFERDYERIAVRVEWRGTQQDAMTYASRVLTDAPVARHAYKQLIVEGARAHELPESWIRWLAALPERPDPR